MIRRFNIGGISLLGIQTILLSSTCWFLVFSRSRIPKAILPLSSLILFITYTLINWLWYYSNLPPVGVIQNLSVYFAFVGFAILSLVQSHLTLDLPEYISRTFPRAIQISVGLYGLNILIGGPGGNVIMGSRSFALFAIIGVAWFLATWRYRLPGGLRWALVTLTILALSTSRTAVVIALILFPLSQISLRSVKSWLRLGITIILIVTISYLAFTYVEPIRSRFSDKGDSAKVGGVQVNTSGRGAAWPVAYASAMESPWIGKGPNTIGTILVRLVGPAFAQPHNDYLRIFHDFGIIGLIMWLPGYFGLIVKTWQNWHWADRYDIANAHVHLAAFLALVAVSLGMTTDNILIYIFSMAPLGILVGASLGSGSRRQKMIKSTRKLALLSSNLEQITIKS